MVWMLSSCFCLCSAVLLYCAVFYYVVLYCVLLCCSLLLFCHYTSVRYCCTVSSILNISLHFTVFKLVLLLLQIWQLVLYFILLCFLQRFWSFSSLELSLSVSLSCIAIAVSFDLVGPQVVMWLIEGHDHGSLEVGTWSQASSRRDSVLVVRKVQVWKQTLPSF